MAPRFSFGEGAFGGGRHPFRAPALPIEEVEDPTGAGDSFAGGFMGYIASQGEVNREVLKRAMFYGGVMGSFAVERVRHGAAAASDARRDRSRVLRVPSRVPPGLRMATPAREPQLHAEEYRHQLAKDLRRVGALAGLLSLVAFLYITGRARYCSMGTL